VIEAIAPVRICDIGGWTDTWFGGPGRIVHLAAAPGVTVVIRPLEREGGVVVHARDFTDRYAIVPGTPRVPRHPLLEAAIDAFPPPPDGGVEITVESGVPAGCGTGTSAAVAVALIGALVALRSEVLSSRQVAAAAHRLEVQTLGEESGVQDQLCAACGGLNFIAIDHYPEATVEPLPAWDELGPRLSLIFLGRGHHSSEVHRQVIEDVGQRGTDALARLREAAVAARAAVLAQDLHAFGTTMTANTDAQAALHPALVGADARRVIDVAARERAVGWKVNGAGGDGGSVTLLSATPKAARELEQHVSGLDARYRVLPITASAAGLVVRQL